MQQVIHKTLTRPKLCEARVYDINSRLPPNSILEIDEGFEIAFNLFGAVNSSLSVLLSQDRKRLHVIAKKDLHDSNAQFLWTFVLPKNVSAEDIAIKQNREVYVISVPKKVVKAQSAKRDACRFHLRHTKSN
jgi:HSP20 family molecular chaperone IbpA